MTTEVSKEVSIDVDATSFAVTSLSLLNSARLNNSYCDFTIKLGDELLTVHKNVLATRSEYFEAMFRSSTSETKTAEVEMRDVDFESVKKCIDYIYTGKASVKQENIGKLMHVAHMMRLKDMCSAIGKLLEKFLNHVTFFSIKNLAHTYNSNVLEGKCDAFALANFESVSTEESFTNLEKFYLVYLLSSAKLVGSESVKLNAIRKWIHKKFGERKIFLPEFLKFVNLSKLPTRYFQSILQNEPLIYGSANILRKFSMSMLQATAAKREVIAVYNPIKMRFQALEQAGDDNQHLIASDFLGRKVRGFFVVVSSQKTLYVLKQNKEIYGIDYNEPSAEWGRLPSMQQDHVNPLAVYHKEMIYVISENVGERFCTLSKKWSSMGDLPDISYQTPSFQQSYYNRQQNSSRKIATGSAITAWNGHIYVIGGHIKMPNTTQRQTVPTMSSVNNVLDYNCSNNTWSAGSFRLSYARYNAVATTCGDEIYVIGGKTDNGQHCNQIEVTNMSNRAQIYIQQSFHPVISAFVNEQTIYVLGGGQDRVTKNQHRFTRFSKATAIDSKTRSVSSINIDGAEVDQLDFSLGAMIKIL